MYSELIAATWGLETVSQAFFFGLTVTTALVALFIPLILFVTGVELLDAVLKERFGIEEEEESDEK